MDTINGLNQVTSTGSTAIGYDGRGDLTSLGSDFYTYASLLPAQLPAAG